MRAAAGRPRQGLKKHGERQFGREQRKQRTLSAVMSVPTWSRRGCQPPPASAAARVSSAAISRRDELRTSRDPPAVTGSRGPEAGEAFARDTGSWLRSDWPVSDRHFGLCQHSAAQRCPFDCWPLLCLQALTPLDAPSPLYSNALEVTPRCNWVSSGREGTGGRGRQPINKPSIGHHRFAAHVASPRLASRLPAAQPEAASRSTAPGSRGNQRGCARDHKRQALPPSPKPRTPGPAGGRPAAGPAGRSNGSEPWDE